MIAILTPMRKEVELILEQIEDAGLFSGPDKKFTLGRLEDREVGVFCCGVGRRQAGKWMEYIYTEHHPRGLILAGTAGALTDDLDIGDLILALGFFLEGEAEKVECPLPEFLGKNLGGLPIKQGVVLTSDRVVQEQSLRRQLYLRYRALCVEMEGYEVARSCRDKGLPLIALRVISDKANKNIAKDFNENLDSVTARLNRTVIDCIKNWP